MPRCHRVPVMGQGGLRRHVSQKSESQSQKPGLPVAPCFWYLLQDTPTPAQS